MSTEDGTDAAKGAIGERLRASIDRIGQIAGELDAADLAPDRAHALLEELSRLSAEAPQELQRLLAQTDSAGVGGDDEQMRLTGA